MPNVIGHICWERKHERKFTLGRLEVATGEMNLTEPNMSFADVMRVGTWNEKHLRVSLDRLAKLAFVAENVTEPNLCPASGERRCRCVCGNVRVDFSGCRPLTLLAQGMRRHQLGLTVVFGLLRQLRREQRKDDES